MNGLRNVRILDGEDAIGCTYVLTYKFKIILVNIFLAKLIKMGGALLLDFYHNMIILTYLVIIVQCTLSLSLSLFWQRHGQCPGRAGRPSWQRGLKELSTLT